MSGDLKHRCDARPPGACCDRKTMETGPKLGVRILVMDYVIKKRKDVQLCISRRGRNWSHLTWKI